MLEAILEDEGRRGVADVAADLGIPAATAYRQLTTLMDEGYLVRIGRGRFVAGHRLARLARRVDERQLVVNVASPVLAQLASRLRSVVQLGTLDDDMVTYRVKVGRGATDLFTRVGMQLEAYCSGIGKVLLAHLPDAAREAYLAAGPFVPLTEHTITEPAALREELFRVRALGYARDDREIAADLSCLAVPVLHPDGRVVAAISVSRAAMAEQPGRDEHLIVQLHNAADDIAHAAFGAE